MKIAIIGAGHVGGTLGAGWAGRGHEIFFGVRNTTDPKLKDLLARTSGNVHTAKVNDAAAAADVVALTVPWPAVDDALKSAGDLRGKILLDSTNPLKPDLSGLETGFTTSGGEHVAARAPGARVVKIFNTTGFPNMANPEYREGRAMMLYCGDDAQAKKVAAQLATELGFEPYDVGPLTEARLLEPFALVWIHLAVQQKMGTGFAFQLMRR
jgi:predicted dinucleotide-binding enzyme